MLMLLVLQIGGWYERRCPLVTTSSLMHCFSHFEVEEFIRKENVYRSTSYIERIYSNLQSRGRSI
jgi:hypothetical protein